MKDKKGKQGRTKHEVEEIVEFIRLDLYNNRGIPCGAQAIQQQMEELNIKPYAVSSNDWQDTGTVWTDSWTNRSLSRGFIYRIPLA